MVLVGPEEKVVEFRVILVGRTGLDAALRLDPNFEIVRVRTPLEAIAELATPVDDESPGSAVVILAPDIQKMLLESPEPLNPGEEESHLSGPQRVAEFIRGLKLVDPDIRVLGVRSSVAGVLPEMYDSIVDPAASANEVRAAVRAGAGLRTPQPRPIAPQQTPKVESLAGAALEPKPAPCPPAAQPLAAAVGDGELVEMLLKGRDVFAAAMTAIRERTGDPALEFIQAEQDQPAPVSPEAAPVVSAGMLHGYLVPSAAAARTVPPDVVKEHAAWLANWLRLRDQQIQLRQAAFTDPLTGAWNRRYYDRFMASAIETARSNRWSVTVLVFDIDDFKRYNDAAGHEAGDEILKEIVKLLRSVIRPTDRVCRIGGDEFAVIFHEPRGPRKPDSRHPQSVHDIAKRFQEQVNRHKFSKLSGLAQGVLTVSGGLATYPWDGATPGELLQRADELALESKRQGKNCITFGLTNGG